MSASLVGSEMCIRDSPHPRCCRHLAALKGVQTRAVVTGSWARCVVSHGCLLYTSDAADDM
eukprot:1384447-Alexandrium_andersonii.AAC.1